MSEFPPIFEKHTSPLRSSNDGRLGIGKLNNQSKEWVIFDDWTGDYVLTTESHIIADAYLAGYDLATEREETP